MVNIEIDGKLVEAKDGAMVIEAADDAGIPIPRFCYHKKLSIAANCRMCLVEVEKAAKPLPACATPVTEGMKIYTKSPRALDAQKGVMEFLLINHPLDCPICDQGGECDLQEMALGYGASNSRFMENKRVVKDKDIGPLIATEMTRCIHCTRCVRFGEEIAGIKELGATGRGEHMEIGTYVEKALASEMSGNVIDLCPVGALTSKPFRYAARAWELVRRDTVAPHDCIGSNLHVDVRGSQVMRVLPRENEEINETWISDRDRFSYEGLSSADRLRTPMIKKDGHWQETDWTTAFEFTVAGLKSVLTRHGASQLGALISPIATTEEMYLTQKLVRSLGGSNVDHRLRQRDFSDQQSAPVYPWIGQAIPDLEYVDAALLIGSNVRKEQPIAAHRLRMAAMAGASVMFVNAADYEFNFPVKARLISGVAGMERDLGGVAKALLHLTGGQAPVGLDALLVDVAVNDAHKIIAQQLRQANKATVLMGSQALAHPAMSTLRALAGVISQLSNAVLGYLPEAGNSVGGWLAGALPHRGAFGKSIATPGLDARAMLDSKLKAYLLLGIEPEFDCADPSAALTALTGADFVVSLSSYKSELMQRYANVILPIGPFTETSGTFVNAEGRWQSFTGVVSPLGESRPGWKVLRVLSNLFGLDGFDYFSSEEVRDELRTMAADVKADNAMTWSCPSKLGAEAVSGTIETPMYAVDAIVRRASSLQKTADGQVAANYFNEIEAIKVRLGLQGAESAVPSGKVAAHA
ncbi:MAG: NADH-quinone oxidoreductase subunit G [Gammaproteobacteria bacterium]|nr:NADH-quinone oxidoreductase subunit G [Gammaproteobacteria bacterium]